MSNEVSVNNPILTGLMDRRTVVLSGEINKETIATVSQRFFQLQLHSSDMINLLIDSPGGEMRSALFLCDILTSVMTAPVRGIVIGECSSAATFILLSCKERMGTFYSRYVIHSATRNQIRVQMNDTTSERLEQILREVKASEETITRLYMRTLQPANWNESTTEDDRRTFVKQLIARGDQEYNAVMSSDEAVEVGLIQSIIAKKLDIFPASPVGK
jgi:ATP-dependent protease ClpP protease subunit